MTEGERKSHMELICLGDSITYGYGVKRSQRWTDLAEAESGWKLHNYGVCGDTCGGMLARLRELLQTLPGRRDERFFLLMGGCNDIFYPSSSAGAKENMAAMVHQLFSLGEAPMVGICPGIAEGNYPLSWVSAVDFAGARTMIQEYGQWQERFCNAFGVRCVDFRSDFTDRGGKLREDLYLDGLHPNREGHRVMAERILKVIAVMEREQMNP